MSEEKKKSKVGYKKPPKEKQFKKGKSGNPKGRPKAPPRSHQEILNNVLEKEITFHQDSSPLRGALYEAICLQVALKAAKGDMRAASMIMQYTIAIPKASVYDADNENVPMEPVKSIIIRTVSGRLRPNREDHITPDKSIKKDTEDEDL